ncbi:MAG: hypothetical protein E7L17_06690 [Clostridium sp.]|uniref:hypothetical protein n=1 Tax=Clostridium sp. TaxID=1506 RepID=UPI00290F920E|nr:hypothetical protein [Clostridium sp.]MDU7337785.1 hypothetical protein [Clostridium sp.]
MAALFFLSFKRYGAGLAPHAGAVSCKFSKLLHLEKGSFALWRRACPSYHILSLLNQKVFAFFVGGSFALWRKAFCWRRALPLMLGLSLANLASCCF